MAAKRNGSTDKASEIAFALAPRPDIAQLADTFARDGVVSVPDVLTLECATALHALLRARGDWRQAINSGDKLVELDRPTRAGMAAEQVAQLDTAVYAGARQGFQFRYETLRVPDDAAARRASDDPLAAFALWWSSGEPRDLLRRITGMPAIAFADAQATAYAPGDFLTEHTDDVDGKGRLAAYVLNLTPRWRIEWGGLLLFHGDDGTAARALVPAFNRLNLFAVPRPHSVSEVSRASPYRRYAITGWLRKRAPGAAGQ